MLKSDRSRALFALEEETVSVCVKMERKQKWENKVSGSLGNIGSLVSRRPPGADPDGKFTGMRMEEVNIP